MRKFILAALLAGTVATPALAQDAAPFTGLRVEGLIGYEATDVEDENTDGIAYGVGVGYDVQSGSGVFGIEAEATESSVDECVRGVVLATDTLCAKVGRDLYVGGRAGALIGVNTLLYAKAGYTNNRVKAEYQDGTAGTALDLTEKDDLDGIRVGGGVEIGVGTNAFVKGEYRYSNYEQGYDKHQGLVGFGVRF